MAIDEAKFKQLKKRATDAREARDKAAGQLEATMERLETEFGCTTIKAAEKKAAKLAKDADIAEGEYDAAVEAFEGEWNAHLED